VADRDGVTAAVAVLKWPCTAVADREGVTVAVAVRK
jgi:hypothetical protein